MGEGGKQVGGEASEALVTLLRQDCICANSTSHTRELVNVSLEGVGCYACELTRTPACTEAADQCTPEPCECGDPNLVKRLHLLGTDAIES
eukprot:5191183-Amphidinium_carterae.1